LQLEIGETDTFVAIDFETADYGRDSACAVGLVRVEQGRIVQSESHLIRPPRSTFAFTHIHGITWTMVAGEPTFGEWWPRLSPILVGVEFLAAHNASFDRSVLEACSRAAGLQPTDIPFLCTMRLARRAWGIRPTRLPDVCRHLGLRLNHHEALSDAEACARIVLAARAAPLAAVRSGRGGASSQKG
jgi:DNA polymerase-3 subunit epsilon